MGALIMFVPYILVPLMATLLVRRFHLKIWPTYLSTALIIFSYPFVYILSVMQVNPQPAGSCMTGEAAFVMGNTVFMLPLSLLIQFTLNLAFHYKRTRFW